MPLPRLDQLRFYKSLPDFTNRLNLQPLEADKFFLINLGDELHHGYYPDENNQLHRLYTGSVRVIDVRRGPGGQSRTIIQSDKPVTIETFKTVLRGAGFREEK